MICNKTTQWSFTTLLTALATNTTLGTATRHDFAAITIHTPEAPSGSFTIKSAVVVVTARDAFTAATDFDGTRIGIKLGAVAFDDVDYTLSLTTTNDHETLIMQRDVTDYFVTNFGAAASQTCQVGVAFSTGAIASVNNITCELFLTYDYDNAAGTHCKTVEIPIQGHHTQLTTVAAEVGTAGVSPAPANQIPQLTGAGTPFLPEAGITVRQMWLRIIGTDGGNAATDFNLFVQVDAGVELTRATLEQALASAAPFKDLVDLVAYGMSTTAAHALNMRSSLTSTFHNISAVLVVTYTFTTAGTTREVHSCRVPLENIRGQIAATNANAAGDDERYTATVEVQEPGTITTLQSGVVLYDQLVANLANAIYAAGQAERTHTYQALSYTGASLLVRRTDHDLSDWTLVRGSNRLNINYRVAGTSTIAQQSGFALINYSADIPSGGIGSGNRTVFYDLADHQVESSGAKVVTPLRVPSIPMSPWVVSGTPGVVLGIRGDIRAAITNFGAERGASEDSAGGWASWGITLSQRIKACRQEACFPLPWFKSSSYDTRPAMNLTTSRSWKINGATTANFAALMFFTVHQCRFTVAGTLTINGAAAANGKTIKVWAFNASNEVEYVGSSVTAGGAGAFTFNAPDDTRTYFCTHHSGTDYGISQETAPGGSFDIAAGSAPSGGSGVPYSRAVNRC